MPHQSQGCSPYHYEQLTPNISCPWNVYLFSYLISLGKLVQKCCSPYFMLPSKAMILNTNSVGNMVKYKFRFVDKYANLYFLRFLPVYYCKLQMSKSP